MPNVTETPRAVPSRENGSPSHTQSAPLCRPRLASVYLRLAETLERSAQLSEAHAERERNRQRWNVVAIETDRADRARRAALYARKLASRRWI